MVESLVAISDETIVQDVPWAQFKYVAMQEDFKLDDQEYSFSQEEKEILKRLIKAQNAQGDMDELISEAPQNKKEKDK